MLGDCYVIEYKESLFLEVTGRCSHQNDYLVSVMTGWTLLEMTKPEGQPLLREVKWLRPDINLMLPMALNISNFYCF